MSTIDYNNPEIKKQINVQYNQLYVKVVNNLATYIENITDVNVNEQLYIDNLTMLDMMKQTIEKFNNLNP